VTTDRESNRVLVRLICHIALTSQDASSALWAEEGQRGGDRLGSQLEHHRRQAAGAAAMRADERVARLHHPLVPLIRWAEGRFDRLEVLSESRMREAATPPTRVV
jgi:hypothetical protein